MKENHLSKESSPYLKQHAHNPVDWYPWSEESLARAKKEDKPMIVSIGYSTCHWCHVMERESFENEEIAKVMNANFVCIKIDREERPDIDQVYMDAVSAMGLRGGWPLNVFLTPDRKPFYGGTYFPPKGWLGLLKNIADVFHSQRDELENSAQKYVDALSKEALKYREQTSESSINTDTFDRIKQRLIQNFDAHNGGTTGAPKFPMPSMLNFLAQSISQNKSTDYSKQLFLTLDKMVLGGIYDQIGGGFARYSTDDKWFAPHFEKMLYDNGQLVGLYSKAYKSHPKSHYKEAVYQTVDWLKREMTDANGGFYSALDADSEGVEGKFYVWTDEELQSILGKDYELVKDYYQVTEKGNWENDWNILHRKYDNESYSSADNLHDFELKQKISSLNKILLGERAQRIRPSLDDKILLGWNALMSSGLIEAYKTFGEEEFLQVAKTNIDFMLNEMCEDNTLFHSYRKKLQGYMDDYALFIEVLIELYHVTFEERYLIKAESLTHYTLQSFYDKEADSFFYTSRDSEKLIVDKKEMYDNVIPASNSIMANNLLKLGIMMDSSKFIKTAQSMLLQAYNLVIQRPNYMSNWARAFHLFYFEPLEIIIVGEQVHKMKLELSKMNLPNHIMMGTVLNSDLPLLKDRISIDGKTTVYVCQNKTCELPVFSVGEAEVIIRNAHTKT